MTLWKKINRSISKLMRGVSFYNGSSGENVTACASVIACLGDSPERRSINGLAPGTGLCSAWWLHACDLQQVCSSLPSCEECFQRLLDGVREEVCEICANWSFECQNKVLHHKPPKHFPKEQITLESGMLEPQKLTHAKLKAAVTLAHQKVVNSDWDFKAAGVFLSAHSLNGESITTALGHARNAKKLREAEKQSEETEEFQRLKDRKEECPDQFEPWKGPAAWQCEGVELDDCIDAIMHLLFLGIVKSTLQHTVEWLKLKKSFLVQQSCQRLAGSC